MRSSLSVHRLCVIAAGCLSVFSQPASAQSLFETLFGTPKPSYRPTAFPSASRLLPPGGINYGQPSSLRQMPQPRPHDDDDARGFDRSSNGRGGQHTVCVRMCDGYYWPVSYSTSKSRFYRDGNVCSSSCNSEAKLFHYPIKGGQIENAVDLSGLSYSRLPTAFMYRKTRVEGCTCKPEPWSDTEIERHRAYALDDEAAKGSKLAAAPKAAELPPPRMSGPVQGAVAADAKEFEAVAVPVADATAKAPTEDTTTVAAPAPQRLGRKRASDNSEATSTTRPRNRPQQAAQQQRVARQPAAKPKAYGGMWGGGQPQYAWPGDPPVRVR